MHLFEELPTSIVIDSTNQTTLQAEHLLNSSNQLEIIKKYPNARKEKVFVKAHHPTNSNCKDLLQKKDSELRTIISNHSIECSDRNKNAVMRTSIWNHFNTELNLAEIEIDVSKEHKNLFGINYKITCHFTHCFNPTEKTVMAIVKSKIL